MFSTERAMLSDDDQTREDVQFVDRVADLPAILQACSAITGMGFVTVARVTAARWVSCATIDRAGIGVQPGDTLDAGSTICREVRDDRAMIAIPDVEACATYRDHPMVRRYGFRSYLSVPILRADGSVWGTICAVDAAPREITAQAQQIFAIFARMIAREFDRQQELEVEQASLATERDTARLREEFIAIVGHDLRNPIAAVNSGLRMLAARDLTAERRAMLIPEMQRALTRASQIITNLMDFARGRLGAGIEVNAPAPVDLAPVFQDVVEEIRHVAAQPIDCRIALDRPLVADPQRLGQLLSNLLGNAVMHGAPDQPIRVDIAERESELILSVTSRGAPIPDIVRKSLFQPFSRQEGQKSLQGLGLGLYIASEIARAHGGRIEVASTERDGTTFSLRIPTSAGAQPAP